MGKKLIVQGVDFSANAIIDTTHNFITFSKVGGSDGAAVRGSYIATIGVGKKIGFADEDMWERFKMAIAISGGPYPDAMVTWDTQYSGGSYFSENVTVLTQGTQIIIAPIDGTDLSDADLADINADAFFVDD